MSSVLIYNVENNKSKEKTSKLPNIVQTGTVLWLITTIFYILLWRDILTLVSDFLYFGCFQRDDFDLVV